MPRSGRLPQGTTERFALAASPVEDDACAMLHGDLAGSVARSVVDHHHPTHLGGAQLGEHPGQRQLLVERGDDGVDDHAAVNFSLTSQRRRAIASWS